MTILWEFDEKHPKQVSAYEGRSPTIAFLEIEQEKQSKHIIFGPRTLRRTWGTRPVPIGSVRRLTPAGFELSRRHFSPDINRASSMAFRP